LNRFVALTLEWLKSFGQMHMIANEPWLKMRKKNFKKIWRRAAIFSSHPSQVKVKPFSGKKAAVLSIKLLRNCRRLQF